MNENQQPQAINYKITKLIKMCQWLNITENQEPHLTTNFYVFKFEEMTKRKNLWIFVFFPKIAFHHKSDKILFYIIS